MDYLTLCMQCGTCVASCSVKYTLNLRKLIAGVIGRNEGFWDERLWDCTTCHVCQDRCPRGIPLTDLIVEARSRTVEEGRVPAEIRDMLESVRKFGNPFGVSPAIRREWVKDLELKHAEDGDFEYLFFAGCSTIDPRLRSVAKKAAEIMAAAGIDYAVLREEKCCGNDVMVVGEKGLFNLIMEENKELFEKLGVEKLIVTSPHCYHVFKNFYNVEVYHITEVLLEAVEDAELTFSHVVEKRVTYHDPCYLGRYSGIYDAPRELLKSISGIELVEMQRSRELSLCCGAGGGNIIRDLEMRPSLRRIDEAIATGAEVIAVSCPFCHMMLDDAVRVKRVEIKVLDVIELLHMAVTGTQM
jgi:Fe-S oxidoreductase